MDTSSKCHIHVYSLIFFLGGGGGGGGALGPKEIDGLLVSPGKAYTLQAKLIRC